LQLRAGFSGIVLISSSPLEIAYRSGEVQGE